jgi:hypothetical protein
MGSESETDRIIPKHKSDTRIPDEKGSYLFIDIAMPEEKCDQERNR